MTRMEDPNALIATSIGIWLKNAERRNRKTQGSVSSMNKLVIS